MARLVLFALALTMVRAFGLANKEDSRPGFFLLAQWIVIGSAGFAALLSALRGDPIGMLALPPLLVLTVPWPIVRDFAIPRGHWRVAWFLTRSCAWTWYDDNKGGAMVAAAWASLRARDPAPAAAFVERLCERGDAGPASLLATGLLAQARGDLEGARRWIVSLCEFEGNVAPRHARALALEWCVADAAARGAWSSVVRFAGDRDATRATRFLGAVAARLLGRAPVPTDDALRRRARWLPVGLRPLLQRALMSPCEPVDEASSGPVAHTSVVAMPEGTPHEIALQLHARLLAAPSRGLRLADVQRVASAWDHLFADRGFAAKVAARASALASRIDALARLRELADRELLAAVWAGDVAIGEDEHRRDDTLGRLRGRLHQRLLDELEVLVDTLSTRVKARRALAIHEEWREWLALRGAYDRAVVLTGIRLRRVAFEVVHGPACSLGVWLWNDRSQRTHAHQIFLWLLREAEIVEDAEAIALQRRNVDAGR